VKRRQFEREGCETLSREFPDEVAAIVFAEKLAQLTGKEITVRDAEGITLCIVPIKLSS
jgi:hypothetical protein